MSKKPEHIVIEERHRIMCNRKNNKLKKIISSLGSVLIFTLIIATVGCSSKEESGLEI